MIFLDRKKSVHSCTMEYSHRCKLQLTVFPHFRHILHHDPTPHSPLFGKTVLNVNFLFNEYNLQTSTYFQLILCKLYYNWMQHEATTFLIEKIRKKKKNKVIVIENICQDRVTQLLFNTNMHMKHTFRKMSLFKLYD